MIDFDDFNFATPCTITPAMVEELTRQCQEALICFNGFARFATEANEFPPYVEGVNSAVFEPLSEAYNAAMDNLIVLIRAGYSDVWGRFALMVSALNYSDKCLGYVAGCFDEAALMIAVDAHLQKFA